CLNFDGSSCMPASGGGTVTGTGTANTVTKWTGASSIGNSSMTDDGTKISLPEPTTVTANGAASQSGFAVVCTPFTGGSGTTTFPCSFLNGGGAAVTTWNTSGTMYGSNSPSGFTGDQVAIFANNTRVWTMNSGGGVTSTNSFTAGSASIFGWS